MYNQHDWAVEDDQSSVKENVEKSPPVTTPFSLDDAFSDADDTDPNYEFSSIAIRADLARAIPSSQGDEELAGAEESPDVGVMGDTSEILPGPSSSVSGVLVTSSWASPRCRDISSPTLDPNQLDAKFDAVSLSESPVEKPLQVEDHDDIQNGLEATDDGQGQGHTRNSSASETQHGVTYPEESHSDPTTPDASQESPPPPSLPPIEPPPQADTPISGGESETHPGQTTHERSTSTHSLSAPRLDTPSAASSLPRPPPSGHRPTRSTGPSMLEKVVSRTRPSFLPPKSRNEDKRHLADWENMMKQSRAAGTQYFTFLKKPY